MTTSPALGRNAIKWFDVGPDGRSLYMVSRPAGRGGASNLVVADAETGVVRVIGTARAVAPSLSVSPDGAQLAFLAHGDSSGQLELRVIPTAGGGGSRTILRPARGRLGPPVAWTRDGARLLFRLEQDELPGLWAIQVSGGEPLRVLPGCCAENRLRVHPDGRRLAVASGRSRGELWILEVPGGDGAERSGDRRRGTPPR